MSTETTLRVSEIFHSIQGESSLAGWPCAFVRLAGCGHGCRYCDTAYAKEAGTVMTVEQIVRRALAFDAPCIEVTGGEPLLQPGAFELLSELCDRHPVVLLETGGFLPVERVDPRVHAIIDIKAPSSGVAAENCATNFALALDTPERFEFKIVVASREDYEWAKSYIAGHGLPGKCSIIFGPVFGHLEPRLLAEWILRDRLPVRMQLQLHKYIWQPDARGV
ncbi:radical SAM protein [Chlorobaculum thiosulfatiphilum]|uniref:7-carboxy-7-deazaguanine synthase n=1 Tax=Chlorobaculum thiosulfatiphilum TaxID=115852 RepID=A0A5C4S4B5_CHLTI|nr:radical SAM protein [Chlorobaculum thiosulfatiphilum]TNJ38326.1 radical SAM protein [Chlorobaculum thiosulfatiphilum]